VQLRIFCIDVTFEMRTVLSRIHLFNDTILNRGQHFILNRNRGKECKIVERPRERECVSATASGRKEEVASVVKWTVEEIHLVRSI